MKGKVFGDLFWAGAVLIILLSSVIFGLTYGVSSYFESQERIEVVHDTIVIEVIKEIPIECVLPHVQPKSTPVQKPIEQVVSTVEIVEPKDSTL